MKTPLIIAGLLGLAVAGCGSKESSGSSTGQNPVAAPADYVGTVARSKDRAEKVIDTAALNQSVQLFYAQEGRYPKDLNELATEKYLPRLPEPPRGMKIQYDAKTGQVKVVAQ